MQTSNDTKKSRILIVEDVPTIAHIHQLYCDDLGYDVDIASNGEEAIKLYKPDKYFAVLLDVSLPDVDGFDVCKAMREQGQTTTKIITCSAHINLEILSQESGSDAHLEKPITIEELKKTLDKFSC